MTRTLQFRRFSLVTRLTPIQYAHGMSATHFNLMTVRLLFFFSGCAAISFLFAAPKLAAQESVSSVVVTGEEIPSSYGAPPGFSRTCTSPTTTAYVLPPWAFFFGTIYEGDFGDGPPDHLFTQEVEMGLPYRFGLAAEVQAERFNGGSGFQTISLEGRWALADWNKIPLNPTLFAEYKFGVGTIRHEEGPPPPPGEEEGGIRSTKSAGRL